MKYVLESAISIVSVLWGIGCLIFAVIAVIVGIKGLILAWAVSPAFFVFALVAEPLPIAIGLAHWFWNIDLAHQIAIFMGILS